MYCTGQVYTHNTLINLTKMLKMHNCCMLCCQSKSIFLFNKKKNYLKQKTKKPKYQTIIQMLHSNKSLISSVFVSLSNNDTSMLVFFFFSLPYISFFRHSNHEKIVKKTRKEKANCIFHIKFMRSTDVKRINFFVFFIFFLFYC